MSKNQNRAVQRAAQARAAAAPDLTYTQARAEVLEILQLAQREGITFEKAAESYDDDPATRLLCRRCGWSVAMVCPECTEGCGCNNGSCQGWRHENYRDAFDAAPEMQGCEECGAGAGGNPYEVCVC